jgi:hypothetical protein
MARNASSFARGEPKFATEKRILVLCEDTKSGKQYLQEAADYFRAALLVDVAHAGVTHPSGIVAHAIKRQTKYDEVYCAIDRDSHVCFDKAINMAQAHEKIKIVPSYPSFEFWILLHFGYCRKPFNRTERLSPGGCVIKDIKANPLLADYDKGKDRSYFHELLGGPFDTARKVSPRVLKDAKDSNQLNPSTEIHILIEKFESLSAPQKIIT